ncbi:MAG: nucleoside deaminase [Alphaproteobacteria bacterium]
MKLPHRPAAATSYGRRHILLGLAGVLGGGATIGQFRPVAAQNALPPIPQPNETTRASFMHRAFEMRELASRSGDQAFGGVVVLHGRIVGQAASAVIVRHDPTAHADIEAIRDAARRLGTRDLSGAELYVTSKPCPMCETAAYWANIARVYWGESATDAGAPRYPNC